METTVIVFSLLNYSFTEELKMKKIVEKFHTELLPTSNIIENLAQVAEWNKLNWELDLHQMFWKNINISTQEENITFEWVGTRNENDVPVFTIPNQNIWLVKEILYRQYYYITNPHVIYDIMNNTDPQQLIPFNIQHEYLEKITKLILYWNHKKWINSKSEDVTWINRLNFTPEKLQNFFDKFNIPEDYINNHWVWQAGKTGYGYGAISVNSQTVTTHRIMYQLIFGELSDSKMFIRHIGDKSPDSVNPFHLISGTIQDNIRDRDKNVRTLIDDNYGVCKLTNTQVYKIIEKLYYNKFLSLNSLCEEFDIVTGTIGHITANRYHRIIMNKFVGDVAVSKETVLTTIYENIKIRESEIKSIKHRGSKAYQAKLTEREVIKYRFRKYFFNLGNKSIYKTITNHNNVSKHAFSSAINGNSWKSLNNYINATKEMKLLNYPASSTVDDLIVFMKNNPKYQDTFYLDEY